MESPRARPYGLWEATVHGADVDEAAAFYRDVLGLNLFEHYAGSQLFSGSRSAGRRL